MNTDYIQCYGKEMLIVDDKVTPEMVEKYLETEVFCIDEKAGIFTFYALGNTYRYEDGDGIVKLEKGEFKVIAEKDLEVFRESINEYSALINNNTFNYDVYDDIGFSEALELVRKGYCLRRKHWDINEIVVYQHGYPEGILCNAQTAHAWGIAEGDLFKCEPYLQKQLTNGSHIMWTPNIDDLLSYDWMAKK